MPENNLGQMGDILKGLLQLTGRGAVSGAQQVGQFLMEDSPMAILSRLVGMASSIPAQQDLSSSLKGTQTEKAMQSQQQTQQQTTTQQANDPFLKGAEKKLKEAGYQMAEQSIAQQGPEKTSEKFIAMSENSQQRNINNSTLNQVSQLKQQTQQPSNRVFPDNTGIIKQFFEMLGIQESPQNELARAQAGAIRQQKGQKQKEKEDQFFNEMLNPKPVSGETAKQISLLTGAQDALNNIVNVFNQDPALLRNTARPGNPLGQKIKFWTETLANNLIRQESGAAITADERKFIRQLVTPRGLAAALESPSTTIEKIQSIQTRIGSGLNLLQPNQQTRDFIKNALQNGYSREEVAEFLRQKGVFQ